MSTTISRIAATHCTSSSAPLSTCPATSPLWSWSRARSIDRCTSSEVTPSGASASAICPAPRWTLSATAGTWLTNGGITSAHSPTNAANASRTDRKAAGAGRTRRERSQRAAGASSVASSSAMISGRTTTSINFANRPSSTIPPTTMISRSTIAELTARPRGTASSPAQRAAAGAGGSSAVPGSVAGGTSSCAMDAA